jgi:lysophospholipase L1-like esterase
MRRAASTRWGLLFVLVGMLAGCGGGGSTTGPASFNFAQNDPHGVTAYGDSITVGELGERRRGLGLGQRRVLGLVTTNNYPALLQKNLQGLDPAWHVSNRGVSGELTRDGLARLAGVLAADHSGYLLIMEGTNDADRGTDPAVIVGNLDAMVGLAKANNTLPIIGTIPPIFRNDPRAQGVVAAANNQIRTLAQSRRITLAEIFNGMNDRSLFGTSPPLGTEDPLHPNDRGYAVMARIWFDAVQKTIPLPLSTSEAARSSSTPRGTPRR